MKSWYNGYTYMLVTRIPNIYISLFNKSFEQIYIFYKYFSIINLQSGQRYSVESDEKSQEGDTKNPPPGRPATHNFLNKHSHEQKWPGIKKS